MDTENTEQQAAVAVAEPAAPTAPEHHGYTFVVANGALDHDRVTYAEGARVAGSLFSAADFKTLRKLGVLRFEHEVAKAEDVAAQLAAKNALMAEMQLELERVRQQLETAQKRGK